MPHKPVLVLVFLLLLVHEPKYHLQCNKQWQYVLIYIYIYIRIMYTYIYIYMYIYRERHIYIYVYVYMISNTKSNNTYIYIYIYVYVYLHIRTCICDIHIYIHDVRIHTYYPIAKPQAVFAASSRLGSQIEISTTRNPSEAQLDCVYVHTYI